MYTLLRFQAPEALRERGVHEFDAWAAAFGETTTELELQPSGAYKPVTRFAAFINVADLMMMFRSVADVVQKADLRGLVTLPRIRGGQRQLITAEASPAFRGYQTASRRADRGDRGAEGQDAEGRRHPAVRHHRWTACRHRHAPRAAGQRRRAGEQAEPADRHRAPHLGGDRGTALPAARTARNTRSPAPGN